MTLKEFIARFDKDNSIVLLEGKRNVLDADKKKLFSLGKLLTNSSNKIIFRSGNAEGADQYFSDGVTSVDSQRLQLITPYTGHRQKANQSYNTVSLDDIDIAAEPEVIYQSKKNKVTEKLVDKYVLGERNRYSIKAAYLIRDTIKVIGALDILPASFGIFYDDLGNPMKSGTGHTMKICEQMNIPFINQTQWIKWLSEEI